MCTSGCAPTSTCIHTWAGTHRFTRAHTKCHLRCMGCMQVCTHMRLPCRRHTHTHMRVHLTHKHAQAPYQCGCAQTRTCTPGSGSAPPHMWDAERFSAHPSRCLRPPPPTTQLTCQTEGYQAPNENAGVSSASRVFLSFPRDCILVLETGLN